MDLKKMNKTALIVSAVLLVILIGSILALLIGGGKDADKNKENGLGTESTVTDTEAPNVTMKVRYIFTNDITKLTDVSGIVKEVTDTSDYEMKLIRFEKKDVLSEMNELALKNLTEGADSLMEETALAIGSADIPTEQGIYRSVLEIKDTQGNGAYEEVFVILDTDSALINDAADVVVTVPGDKISEKPEVDTSIYKGYDEVDGSLTSKDLKFELTLMDETKHEWKLTISYKDRAGNESAADYKVTVTAEKETIAGNNGNTGNTGTTNNNGNTKPNTGNTNAGNSNNGNSNTGNTNTGNNSGTSNGGSSGGNQGNTSSGGSNIPQYDPADTNKDGWVDANEEMAYITPQKQKCIDAGYGVVVEQDGGEWYSVLCEDGDQLFNGKRGWELLDDYLRERGLHADLVKGCWINSTNGWYWYVAEGIKEIPESTDGTGEIDWDDIEWEPSYP